MRTAISCYCSQFKRCQRGTYDHALKTMSRVIRAEARRHQYLLESDRLTAIDKASLRELYASHLDEDAHSDIECAEYFGFTDDEVRTMMAYYGVMEVRQAY